MAKFQTEPRNRVRRADDQVNARVRKPEAGTTQAALLGYVSAPEMLALQRSAGNHAVDASLAIQRSYNIATTKDKTRLRDEGARKKKGPDIPKASRLLVDDSDENVRTVKKTDWRPALNVPPDQPSRPPRDGQGYIRSKAVEVTAIFEEHLKKQIRLCLERSEYRAWLRNKLATPAHVDFLMTKSIRSEQWVAAGADQFVAAFETLPAKLQRITDGADYVTKVVEHWKWWLNPWNPASVHLTEMHLVKSDLHERGLGVVEVRFTKPKGGSNRQYAQQTDVHAFLKPEDKSLEQELLGQETNSAAEKINTIAGLTGNEQIRTIRMHSTPADQYGTFVEAAKGVKAESYFASYQENPAAHVEQSFHETLIFAYLAGIDDLHRKNVYWEQAGAGATPGIPTLIDADVVMSWSQMNKDQQESSGKGAQSGFSLYNRAEADKNQQAIIGLDNSRINSKILNMMLTNPVKRQQIIQALRGAVAGHKGRIVPIRTNQWGRRLSNYVGWDPGKRDAELITWATADSMVRKGINFEAEVFYDGAMRKMNQEVGPGLYGTAGESSAGDGYVPDAEKEQAKADLDMGSIPFYEYDYDTGVVSHNGVAIYNGVSLDQAMNAMLTRFGG